MELSELKYIKLSPDFEIPPFHCEDDDLNAFLLDDAKDGKDARGQTKIAFETYFP